MRRYYPGPYTSQCQAQCRYLARTTPRLVRAQQQGTARAKLSPSVVPDKLKIKPQGGEQK